jgi:hypothetical protein
MKNTTWHIHAHVPITILGESDTPLTLIPGEYVVKEVDLVSYDVGPPGNPQGRLSLSDLLKLRRSGAITIDGAFP